MIDPISAFSAICAGHAALKKGVEMGKDLGSLQRAISSYAKGEAELQFGEAKKKKSRFSIAEDSAIEKHFKKEKLDDMRNELRSMFQLFGKAGQWERLQAEIAAERARIKKELEIVAAKRERMLIIIVGTVLTLFSTVGGYYYVTWLKGLST
ncbi:hypothetical protein N386_gp60 [Puniceispirillum phage HMO-2011]|jgi:hypothetical protein|uniref:hypothetical protein n=1 Tax=Puniceispirillum phage HMO-2011 TaxID=948071 RepID=UPI000351610C|nr:hypothetical protein N386_gp60 [Puniceispirillum phage HMO-2011]ADW08428.1 hypothetical protein phage1322_60 [Puniceispirillum phage HMO-2011]